MDKADGLGQARQNLTDYLRLNSLRNTPERNALLEVVYSTDVPMQAEELARLMTEGGRLRISRATVYNNLRLFEEAGLLRKVFQDDKVLYERTDKSKGVIKLLTELETSLPAVAPFSGSAAELARKLNLEDSLYELEGILAKYAD